MSNDGHMHIKCHMTFRGQLDLQGAQGGRSDFTLDLTEEQEESFAATVVLIGSERPNQNKSLLHCRSSVAWLI